MDEIDKEITISIRELAYHLGWKDGFDAHHPDVYIDEAESLFRDIEYTREHNPSIIKTVDLWLGYRG